MATLYYDKVINSIDTCFNYNNSYLDRLKPLLQYMFEQLLLQL